MPTRSRLNAARVSYYGTQAYSFQPGPWRRVTGTRVLCVSRSQILLVKHENRLTGEVYDVLPGGGREAGETFAEAGIREVCEETGLQVRIIRLLRVPTRVPHVTYALFLAEPMEHGEPAPTVDLSREEYLRSAAWHHVSNANPLGPLNPIFWDYLAPVIRRQIQNADRRDETP